MDTALDQRVMQRQVHARHAARAPFQRPRTAPSAHMRCTVSRMLVFDASAIIWAASDGSWSDHNAK